MILPPANLTILKSSTTLTAAQIQALTTTPITLVPAPGAGKLLMPFVVWAAFNFVAPQYTGAGSKPAIVFANSPSNASNIMGLPDLSTEAGSYYAQSPNNYPGGSQDLRNQSIIVKNFGTALATGNGTLTIEILYCIIDA